MAQVLEEDAAGVVGQFVQPHQMIMFTGLLLHKQLFEGGMSSWISYLLTRQNIMDFEAAEQLFLACDKDRDGYISR